MDVRADLMFSPHSLAIWISDLRHPPGFNLSHLTHTEVVLDGSPDPMRLRHLEFYGKCVMAPLAGDKQSWEQKWAREVRCSCCQPSQQKRLNP